MSSIISVHITVSQEAEALKIARALVNEKLAACVNIIAGVRSIYRWEGQIEEGNELLLLVKTRAELFEQVKKFVKSLHSDLCPCILATPITSGHQAYLDWVVSETKI